MRTKQELIERIDELSDTLACAEHDEEMDGDTKIDIDLLRCEVADLRLELKERFPNRPTEEIADAINDAFARNTGKIAKAITPQDAMAGHDATGGTITSLTEAVVGITGGLVRIASAIQSLAEAVNQKTS
jgi:DNA-binding PucR family transcriptional regulator